MSANDYTSLSRAFSLPNDEVDFLTYAANHQIPLFVRARDGWHNFPDGNPVTGLIQLSEQEI